MRLPRPRFTVRRVMVAVAVVAVALAIPIVVARHIGKALDDFYGPGGDLERQRQVSERSQSIPVAPDPSEPE